MSLLPADLEPQYGALYRGVLAALSKREMDDLPRAVREFVPTEHELSVLRAVEWLLAGRDAEFQPQHLAGGPHPDVAVPRPETLAVYRQQATASAAVLRWSLLLHDLAKQRGLPGPHPEHGARLAERVLAAVAGLSSEEKSLVAWLVRYHDVLGNIYCGERAPAFLLEMSRGLDEAEVVRRLQLLQVVGLCDLRGTWDGALLTEEKARFWLDLTSQEQILERQADLFAWRLKRWSGSVVGVSDPVAEQAVGELLLDGSDAADRDRLESAFGARIGYIVYGFYLFTALRPAELATLMKSVARAVDGLPAGNVTLLFETVYRPPQFLETAAEKQSAEKALHHYTAQLRANRLAIRAEVDQGLLLV